MDLLVLAISVFAADTRISRSVDSQDGWTREIDLYVPVSDPTLWQNQREILQDMLGFLTGDRWQFIFRPRPSSMKTIAPPKTKKLQYKADTVCLFSGGLDSFIGAIDLLQSDIRPILLGHHKSSDVGSAQRKGLEYLQQRYKDNKPEFVDAYVKVPKELFKGAEEKTERGRSFLFLSLGTACASALGKRARLVVPENGVISLNVPLTPLRLGAATTRTTHPYFTEKFQELLDALGIGVSYQNPYQFKTKGEMLRECRGKRALKGFAHETMSCAHPSTGRWLGRPGHSITHCGCCVPCLIRRAAFRAADGEDTTQYSTDLYTRPLRAEMSEGEHVQAFKMALARLRKTPQIAEFLIYKTGPLKGDSMTIAKFADVYRRGMAEVDALLDKVTIRR
jgi:7-cyano-7-deazaguanine synthase in queuosine biosynthesis